MQNIFQLLPSLEGEEMSYVQSLIKDMTDTQAQQFAMAYSARRKDPTTILILALVGFVGFAGLHRFMLNQIGMGILYFLTGGLCLIGTIIDLVNHRKLAFEYNSTVAQQVALMTKQIQ
ncbi:MAG: TM2 domain-containing protein [Ignavibacteriaceae bacterium]|nr:TM2 domain-containing protein [Ignavibacteriaceae bacterium]HMN24472.1 TM2 domain-containing protein [Ignavibacteriaceae bacterium]HRN27201.1 TM2 domain-containing protein [Ignavibacteriaceae bacterium]HRP92766.1 TM2 domain-containing protein [Ignavibacteriaceae bacterium]HRQ55101.1 TM2 domain-containing protein [Ignavibacteriaceae bacterium]